MAEADNHARTRHTLGWRAWLGQAVLYGLFALVIGVFSHWPPYRHLPPDTAVIKLSVLHTGKPKSACHQLSAEELAALPPNMRAPVSCPRERSPVVVELDIDGAAAARIAAPPSGLSGDGASAIYTRLAVAAGERAIAVRLRDDANNADFAYHIEQRVTLAPAQVLVIDFDAEHGEITLQ
ncbi:MAG: hypothetical protein IT492_23635 [Gammaproteobacteria bacterium]|jgi:hypothetical protein|nr:hypothetical protein [Gammaproteobacteria bacterium]